MKTMDAEHVSIGDYVQWCGQYHEVHKVQRGFPKSPILWTVASLMPGAPDLLVSSRDCTSYKPRSEYK